MSSTGRATVLLALLLAALVYLPRLGAPLMWDDRPYLIDVPAYDAPIPLKRYVEPGYFGLSGEATWRPLATFVYATGVRAFGRRPLPLRLASLALHLLDCALLGLLVAALGLGAETAAAAAALFLVHPVHVETLMTATFDKEPLAALGILAMLLAHRRGRPLLAAAALAFGALAKETGVLGLALAPLADLLTDGPDGLRRRWKDHALYAAVAAAYLFIRFGPMKGPGGEANLSAALPWTERLVDAAHGFAVSFRVLFAPVGLRIEYFALPPSSAFAAALWLAAAAAILSAILLLAWRLRRSRPALAFFLLWPLPILFLTSNILPTGVLSLRLLAERWLYLPSAGVMVAVGYFLRDRPARLRLLLIVLAALGAARIADWSDETRLWRSLVAVYPWSAKAVEGLGEAQYRAGKFPDALASFQTGLSLRRDRRDLVLLHYVPYAPPGTISWESAPLDRWLALTELRLGDDKKAEDFFAQAVGLQPADLFSYRALAYTCARDGDFPAARGWLDKGLARAPDDDFLRKLKSDVEKRRVTFQARFD